MTSFGSFVPGSASSTSSMRDAIESYRRAQYLSVGSAVISSSDLIEHPYDEESGPHLPEDESEFGDDESDLTPTASDRMSRRPWNDSASDMSVQPDELSMYEPVVGPYNGEAAIATPSNDSQANENSPLLHKTTFPSSPRMDCTNSGRDSATIRSPTVPGAAQRNSEEQADNSQSPSPQNHSPGSAKAVKYNYGGKSTFGQTLFNCIAILLGIGMLSEPLAFAYAGWIGGTFLMIFYGYVTCYTAKLLAHMILDDPRLRSYADIGRKAFGPKATPLTTTLFFLELFTVSVVLVTLYADSLHSIISTYSANTYKLWGLLLLIPTTLLPLWLLSYASVLGILSTVLVIVVLFIDGFSKVESPGSLWQPAETSLGIARFGELGVACGLFMAGFSGHAVIPSLARDMVNPDDFDTMINWAFLIATTLYMSIGYAGYLMFGNAVSEEVSRDLLDTPGFNNTLNRAALWMLVIGPLTKFALTTRPVNITLEIMLGLETVLVVPQGDSQKQMESDRNIQNRRILFKKIATVLERAVFTVLSVTMSILVPDFSQMMALLGSFSAFILCVIYPISAKVMLERKCGLFDAFLLVVSVVMAIWGTSAAFWSA